MRPGPAAVKWHAAGRRGEQGEPVREKCLRYLEGNKSGPLHPADFLRLINPQKWRKVQYLWRHKGEAGEKRNPKGGDSFHSWGRDGGEEGGDVCEGACRPGAPPLRLHAEAGGGDQYPGQAHRPPSFGLPLEALGSGTAGGPHFKAGKPEQKGEDISVCNRKYVRLLQLADFGEQAEIYQPDHDQQIPGTCLWGCGWCGAELCGNQGPGYREYFHKREDGSGYPGQQAEAVKGKPYQPEIPPGDGYCPEVPGGNPGGETADQRTKRGLGGSGPDPWGEGHIRHDGRRGPLYGEKRSGAGSSGCVCGHRGFMGPGTGWEFPGFPSVGQLRQL